MPKTPAANSDTRKHRCNRRVAGLQNERTSWDSHWKELARFFMPRRGRFFLSDANRGDKRHQDIINGTTLFAARTLPSGMMGGATSPARPWFRLGVEESLAEISSVKLWLAEVEKRMRTIFAKSNLYQCLPLFYAELGVFGTGCFLSEEDDDDILRFYPLTIGSYWLGQNSAGRVDTLYRELKMTVRQVVEKFGIDKCSPALVAKHRSGSLEEWVDVCHLIEPNDQLMPDMLDESGMKWSSYYWEKGERHDQKMLRERGYRENPIHAARWSTTGEDVYGTSPGMDALGDAKALQVQEKRKAMAIDKHLDPPMNAPGEMRQTQTSLLPGAVNYLASPNAKFEPAYQVMPNLPPLLDDINSLERRINTCFYVDLFLMLTMDARAQPPTAEEIRAREQEKLLMLGPVLERLNDEVFDPLIDRAFAAMVRAGEIPPPPLELQQGTPVEIKVEYISVLHQAQKMAGLSAQDRLIGYVGQIAALNPDVLDKIDWDQSVDEYGAMLGTTPSLILSDEVVAAKREAKQKMQMAQQMAAAAKPLQEVAGAAKSLSEAGTGDGTVLRNLLDAAPAAAEAMA